MTDQATTDLAILAPVPIMILKSAMEDDLEEVAFGSTVYDVFNDAENLRYGKPVSVYIYASWLHTDEDEARIVPPSATWYGRYIRVLDSGNPSDRPQIPQRRPSTAKEEKGWHFYWVVKDLRRLAKPLPIHTLRGLNQKRYYLNTFVPERPMLIEYPGNFQ